MKNNWLKPISFTSIFEFEVDPYMEWLTNMGPVFWLSPSFWFLHSENPKNQKKKKLWKNGPIFQVAMSTIFCQYDS